MPIGPELIKICKPFIRSAVSVKLFFFFFSGNADFLFYCGVFYNCKMPGLFVGA
jgi:hypothetical protein